MAITFPFVFANLSGNIPASDLDACFTYTTTLAANATPASSLTGAELVLISQGGAPFSTTLSAFAAATGIGNAVKLQNARTISLTGDVSYTSAGFDGSANVSGASTVVTATTSVAGKVALATSAQTVAGTDATHAVTPASLASASSIAQSGYYKFPGGLIAQWGNTGVITGGGSLGVAFPISFPGTLVSLNMTKVVGGGSVNDACNASGVSTSGFTVLNGATTASTIYWLAMGF